MSDPEDPGGSPSSVGVTDEQDRPVDADPLRSVARAALDALHLPADAVLDITLVTTERMIELNAQAMDAHGATDVLSFPADAVDPSPGPFVLGDVVLCPAVAERQARALGRWPADELAHLLVHGILHLAGHDHADDASERAMAAEERAILARARGEAA